MFIIIVYKLGRDKHSPVSSRDFCRLFQGISHGMWFLAWGRVDDFSFFDCSNPFFLLIEIHCDFSKTLYNNMSRLLFLYLILI